MNEVIYLSEATAARRRVKLSIAVDPTDGITAETGSSVTEGPVQLQAHGGVAVASTNNLVFGDDGDCPGSAYVELTTTELTTLGVGNHRLYFKTSEVAPMIADFSIIPDNPWVAMTDPDSRFDSLDSAVSNLDTDVGSVKTDTTALIAAVSNLDGDVAAVKADTVAIIAAIAALNNVSASAVATAVSNIVIETGVSLKQALAVIGAVLGGNLSGAGTGTEVIKALNNSGTTRVSGAVDSNGNRTITLTLPS